MANTGKQREADTVDSVPEGWEIQGVSNLELTIAPRDFEYDIDNLRADTRGTPEKRLREFARDPPILRREDSRDAEV